MKKINWKSILIFTVMMILALSTMTFAAGISKKSATLTKGQTLTLKVSGAKKVTWKSNKKSVATVSKKGVVKAKKAGTAKITAKVGKKTYTCKIKVVNPKTTKTTAASSTAKTATTTAASSTATTTAASSAAKTTSTTKSSTTTSTAAKSTDTPSTKAVGSASTSAKTAVVDNNTSGMSAQEAAAYRAMVAMKSQFPEGMRWTNSDYRSWKGGMFAGGYGCAAFAFTLSDAAFGSVKAKAHTDFNNIRVGDILRLEKNTHSVIVLKVTASEVVVAEGNYNDSIHWGRVISRSVINSTANYVMTRWS